MVPRSGSPGRPLKQGEEMRQNKPVIFVDPASMSKGKGGLHGGKHQPYMATTSVRHVLPPKSRTCP